MTEYQYLNRDVRRALRDRFFDGMMIGLCIGAACGVFLAITVLKGWG